MPGSTISKIIRYKISRYIFGIVLLMAGIVLYAIAQYDEKIFSLICGSSLTGFWCGTFRIGLFNIGVEGIAYLLVMMSIVMLLFYDFLLELFRFSLIFALRHVSTAHTVLAAALEEGQIHSDKRSEIISSIIARYKGGYDSRAHSFSKFFVENIVEQNENDGGFWRLDFRDNIEVRRITNEGVDSSKFLRWDETVNFTIWNPRGRGVYKYSSSSSCPVDNIDHALEMVKRIKYDVKASAKKCFSFDEYRSSITKARLKDATGFLNDKLSVTYNGSDLSLKVNFDIDITDKETDIIVDEESFISIDDTTYELYLDEPTKGVVFRIAVPEDFEFFHEGISGKKFGTKASDKILLIKNRHNQVRIDSSTWNLPGVFTMLVWRKVAADGAEQKKIPRISSL